MDLLKRWRRALVPCSRSTTSCSTWAWTTAAKRKQKWLSGFDPKGEPSAA